MVDVESLDKKARFLLRHRLREEFDSFHHCLADLLDKNLQDFAAGDYSMILEERDSESRE